MAWFKGDGGGRSFALNVIKKAVTHEVDKHVLIPLIKIPFCFTEFFSNVGVLEHIIAMDGCDSLFERVIVIFGEEVVSAVSDIEIVAMRGEMASMQQRICDTS